VRLNELVDSGPEGGRPTARTLGAIGDVMALPLLVPAAFVSLDVFGVDVRGAREALLVVFGLSACWSAFRVRTVFARARDPRQLSAVGEGVTSCVRLLVGALLLLMACLKTGLALTYEAVHVGQYLQMAAFTIPGGWFFCRGLCMLFPQSHLPQAVIGQFLVLVAFAFAPYVDTESLTPIHFLPMLAFGSPGLYLMWLAASRLAPSFSNR
jgi:hypothetical protein